MKKHRKEHRDLQEYLDDVERRQHSILWEDGIRNEYSGYRRLLDGSQKITNLQIVAFIILAGVPALSFLFLLLLVLYSILFRH